MPSPSLRKDRPSRRLRAPLRHHPQGDKGHGREADRRLRLRALQGPATRPIRALLYLHPERENGAALRAYADSGLVLLSSRSRELRSTWSRLRQAYGPEGTNLSLNVPSMSPDTPMRTIARGTNLSPQCHPDVPWMSPRNPMRTRFCEICPLGRHDPISPKFRPNRHCQSASNRDPGSASKKDPPAGRVEGPQRRDRRRGAGQGERSGVDLVSSLLPLRSRRAVAGFLRSASSVANWRCRSPGCRSGASAGRATPWSSSRPRTRSAIRQTAGWLSRPPRCARRAG